jgi:hypothetical protein
MNSCPVCAAPNVPFQPLDPLHNRMLILCDEESGCGRYIYEDYNRDYSEQSGPFFLNPNEPEYREK